MQTFDGRRVSRRWHRVLTAARNDGVQFVLNSGRRTMAEQAALFRQNMVWNGSRFVQRPGRPLTAFPNPNAPHILVLRQAHALDVGTHDGGESDLQRWLEGKGADVSNPVNGEPWHMVVSETDLARLAAKLNAAAKRERREREAKRRAAERKREEVARWEARQRRARDAGAKYVDIIADHCRRLQLPLALGLALIEKETGFENEYGHDRDSSGNVIWHGQTGKVLVTKANYKAYKAERGPRGQGGMQGVGPAQLTWWELQDRADQAGGCWLPEHNIGVGLTHLASLIEAHGHSKGIERYNGSGPAAEAYSRDVRAKQAKWAKVLG